VWGLITSPIEGDVLDFLIFIPFHLSRFNGAKKGWPDVLLGITLNKNGHVKSFLIGEDRQYEA